MQKCSGEYLSVLAPDMHLVLEATSTTGGGGVAERIGKVWWGGAGVGCGGLWVCVVDCGYVCLVYIYICYDVSVHTVKHNTIKHTTQYDMKSTQHNTNNKYSEHIKHHNTLKHTTANTTTTTTNNNNNPNNRLYTHVSLMAPCAHVMCVS